MQWRYQLSVDVLSCATWRHLLVTLAVRLLCGDVGGVDGQVTILSQLGGGEAAAGEEVEEG